MEKKYRLSKEFATKWLAALRSGEYQQAKEELYDGKGYCCLGVACVLADVHNNNLISEGLPDHVIGFLPSDFPKELLGESDLVTELTSRNDGKPSYSYQMASNSFSREWDINTNSNQLTFPQLADWLEANVEFY